MSPAARPPGITGCCAAFLLLLGGSCAPGSPPGSAATSSELRSVAGTQAVAPLRKVKLAFAPTNITNLPLFLATEKRYFEPAGLDIDYTPVRGSAAALLPQLARGDLDIVAGLTPSPALYNQLSEGFDIKVVASAGKEKEGRLSPVWLTVLPEKAREIEHYTDLKGRTVEGGSHGSALSLVAVEAIRQAGLSQGRDVTLTYRARAAADFLSFARNKVADVIAMNEPSATQIERDGLVVRWKSLAHIAPWYSPGLVGAAQAFLIADGVAAAKFLEVYIRACREVNASDGAWTGELLGAATKWTGFEAAAITNQGKVPYYDPDGAVRLEALERTQQFWTDEGQIKQKVDVSRLREDRPREEALKSIEARR